MALDLNFFGLVLAAVLSLLALSYVFGEHPLFRVVLYLFIGVSAGYAAAVVVQDVLLPQLVFPVLDELFGTPTLDLGELGIRVALALLLLAKLFPKTARLGNPATALLAGVGAALAVAGAAQGTILPQVAATRNIFDVTTLQLALQGGYYLDAMEVIFSGLLLVLASVSTLAYFHFGATSRGKQEPQRSLLIDSLAWLGSFFIAIALAALFHGVLLAALGALVERLDFLQSTLRLLLGMP
ncbi:MAG: hypothetical protein KIT46_04740 [Anaerolineales bacterium]|nr:hypothetical protein [Anaerolineales bacterium]MCW5855338.1 hypothetical protein [Anaerolineales bacterium]